MSEDFMCWSSLLCDYIRGPLDKAQSLKFCQNEMWPNLRIKRPKLLRTSRWSQEGKKQFSFPQKLRKFSGFITSSLKQHLNYRLQSKEQSDRPLMLSITACKFSSDVYIPISELPKHLWNELQRWAIVEFPLIKLWYCITAFLSVRNSLK